MDFFEADNHGFNLTQSHTRNTSLVAQPSSFLIQGCRWSYQREISTLFPPSLTAHPTPHLQIFESEISTFQGLLNEVHASARSVASVLRGLEPPHDEVNETVKQLLNNEVPHAWAEAGPDLNRETVAAWLTDLQVRRGLGGTRGRVGE